MVDYCMVCGAAMDVTDNGQSYCPGGPHRSSKDRAEIARLLERVDELETVPLECSDCMELRDEIERLRTERDEAHRVAGDARNDNEAIHRELDRLQAPRRQESGFGYSPLGRLRALATQECGEGLKDALKAENALLREERHKADSKVETARLREERYKAEIERLESRVKELEALADGTDVSFAALSETIDSQHTRDEVYALVVPARRKAEKAEARVQEQATDITRLLRAATPRHLSSIPTVDQAVTRITAWRDTCARMWPDLQDHIPRDTDAVPTAEIALQKETRRANGAILAFRESEDDVTRQRERAQEAESRVKERDSEIAALGSRITELEAGKKAALEMAHSANKRADEANAQCDSLSGLLFGVGD